jgi:hypothetical protein
MLLRNLSLQLDELGPADRKVARRLLARPTSADPDNPDDHGYTVPEAPCLGTTHFCVHWVEQPDPANGLDDRPPGADGDPATVPPWVRTTADTFEHVYAAIVGAQGLGYRAPLRDLGPAADQGPDDRLDIYLADTGDNGIYGYCISDDPRLRADMRRVSAYCVVDNDFATTDFPGRPLDNLRVTAAHEFFHAVQAAYDWGEDPWFMEGTAVWVEDEVYDSINDNLQYLRFNSPLSEPEKPLDYFSPGREPDRYYSPYGSWVFWRFLGELTGSRTAENPAVIREIWQAAVGRRYSLAAVAKVLPSYDLGVADALQLFGVVNRMPARFYQEGRTYPTAPLAARHALSRRHRSTGAGSLVEMHLSTRTVRFTAGSSLRGRWRLRVQVDMPDTRRGSRAALVVHRRDGRVSIRPLALSRTGAGAHTVDFSRSRVRFVELALTNASTRYRCNRGTPLSCAGVPRDDFVKTTYRGTVRR